MPDSPTTPTVTTDEDAIWTLVTRLARPRAEGGHVIERAAILAAGSNSAAIEAWILGHDGRAEQTAAPAAGSSLHGERLSRTQDAARSPRRFLLPAGALDGSAPHSHN